jgi:hypothetical protein
MLNNFFVSLVVIVLIIISVIVCNSFSNTNNNELNIPHKGEIDHVCISSVPSIYKYCTVEKDEIMEYIDILINSNRYPKKTHGESLLGVSWYIVLLSEGQEEYHAAICPNNDGFRVYFENDNFYHLIPSETELFDKIHKYIDAKWNVYDPSIYG